MLQRRPCVRDVVEVERLRAEGLGEEHARLGLEPVSLAGVLALAAAVLPDARRRGLPGIAILGASQIALVLVLFGVLVSYLNPLVNLVHAWSDSKAGEERLAELREENSGLQEQVREASSPLTLELEARRLGMVKPGEHAYVIRGLD